MKSIFDDVQPLGAKETPGRRASKVQSVDELSARIRDAIAMAPALRNVAVRGEVQNFKRHSSGHVYFTLVGSESRISAVLFRSHASAMIAWPEDGDEVMVTGSVDVYPRGGAYQLYATRIMPIGLGAQARAKEELRIALEKEGLFDIRHKRPLPKYPSKVAVVTSPTGAAVQDVLKVSAKRAPFVDLVIIPAVVQGVDAPLQVARALAAAGAMCGVDCVILARGGGARDDLSPFDDERIVRAVRSCPLPVVTGVGHQTDSSLADLAADLALPTPSAAAEAVFPDMGETLQLLSHRNDVLRSRMLRSCEKKSDLLESIGERMQRLIEWEISDREEFLTGSMQKMSAASKRTVESNEAVLASMAVALDAFSPLAVLGRGYAICRDETGSVVRSVAGLSAGETIELQFKDGRTKALLQEVVPL